ncbi:hypothetical protein [Kitasatospora sp. NPDC056531]|uniref:hypothetical protein n=1 Tax=Kitasatospora sp. NPDC056531 TaxID=3345856 RepID=UPI0036C9AE41
MTIPQQPTCRTDRWLVTRASLDPVALSMVLSQASTRADLNGYADLLWLSAGYFRSRFRVSSRREIGAAFSDR